jgi:hypothetical protein
MKDRMNCKTENDENLNEMRVREKRMTHFSKHSRRDRAHITKRILPFEYANQLAFDYNI